MPTRERCRLHLNIDGKYTSIGMMHVRARVSRAFLDDGGFAGAHQSSPALFVNGRGGTCGGPTRAFQLRCVPKPPPGFESPHIPDSRAVSGCLRTGNPNDATPSLLPCPALGQK